MSTLTMVTLRDGSKVYKTTFDSVSMNLKALARKNNMALYDLVEKCKNAQYKFVATPFGDTKALLKTYKLMNTDEEIHDDIKKIVLNSVTRTGYSYGLINPLKVKQVLQM